jgi:hypothetical protein
MKIKKWLLAKKIASLAGQYHAIHGNTWNQKLANASIKAAADVPIEILESTRDSIKETISRGDKEINIKIDENCFK